LGYDEGITGIAGQRSIAHLGLFATFHGKNAHAGINPWDGVNALDALVCAYNNISVLRQQMRPEERVHGSILEAPKVANVIPDFTKVGYSVRGPTIDSTRALGDKVIACFRAAGLATGCEVELSEYSYIT
jgi:metal-dependent amidase/aminoacylase/carboxypeptidase family protein